MELFVYHDDDDDDDWKQEKSLIKILDLQSTICLYLTILISLIKMDIFICFCIDQMFALFFIELIKFIWDYIKNTEYKKRWYRNDFNTNSTSKNESKCSNERKRIQKNENECVMELQSLK
jgi:hypothetical protein